MKRVLRTLKSAIEDFQFEVSAVLVCICAIIVIALTIKLIITGQFFELKNALLLAAAFGILMMACTYSVKNM